MQSFIRYSFAVLALLFAMALPAFAEESNRGLFEGDMAGGSKAVFFVQGNHALSAYFFDVTGRQVSFAGGAVNDDGSFTLKTQLGVSFSGKLTSDKITLKFNDENLTLVRVKIFGSTADISGRFTGSGTSSNGSLDNVRILVDSQGNIFFLGSSSGRLIGGFGSITIQKLNDDGREDDADEEDDDDRDQDHHEDHHFSLTFTGNFTITGLNGETITGTLMFSHGTITGKITINGTTYDFNLDRESSSNHLANLSTRGFVNTGQGQLIAGFIVTGGPKLVLIRALGPSLAAEGVSPVLANPQVQLYESGQSTPLRANDDWQSAPNKDEIESTQIAPKDPKESAILVRLEPGTYPAVVSGADGGTGIGLVEVYEITND